MPPKQSLPGGDHFPSKPVTTFAQLIALKHLETSTKIIGEPTDQPEIVERFEAILPPFNPGVGQRAFGGHVFAQSAYAASKTVKKGFVLHVSIFVTTN